MHEGILKVGVLALPVLALLQEVASPDQIGKWIGENGVAVGLLIVVAVFLLFFYWPWYKERDKEERAYRAKSQEDDRNRYTELWQMLRALGEAEERKLGAAYDSFRQPLADMRSLLQTIADELRERKP